MMRYLFGKGRASMRVYFGCVWKEVVTIGMGIALYGCGLANGK